MSDLSVIIVSYNTRDLLRRCLQTLYASTTRCRLEVFVVDNDSRDGSVPMVREHFPQVRLVENRENRGFAAANNQAIAQAAGRYIFLLNSDTEVVDGSLDVMVDYMEQHPDVGMVGPQLLNADGSPQNSAGSMTTLCTEIMNKAVLRWLFPRRYFYGRNFRPTQPVAVEALVGAAIMARHDMVKDIGPLDADYFFLYEDTDWCLRAHRGEWEVMFLPQAKIYHLRGQSSSGVSMRVCIEHWKNRYLYFKKNYPAWHLWVLRLCLIPRVLLEIVGNGLIGVFRPKARRKAYSLLMIVWWHVRGCPSDAGLVKSPGGEAS